jgi:hypothetical protein
MDGWLVYYCFDNCIVPLGFYATYEEGEAAVKALSASDARAIGAAAYDMMPGQPRQGRVRGNLQVTAFRGGRPALSRHFDWTAPPAQQSPSGTTPTT